LQRCVRDQCSSVNTPIKTNVSRAVTALDTVTLSVTCGEGETLSRHCSWTRHCSVPVWMLQFKQMYLYQWPTLVTVTGVLVWKGPNRLFSSGFPTKILYTFLFSLVRATCPAHLILLDLIVLIMYKTIIWTSVLYECETWPLMLRMCVEGVENISLERTCGPKGEEVRVERRRLPCRECHLLLLLLEQLY
jgi:hypothetical protein